MSVDLVYACTDVPTIELWQAAKDRHDAAIAALIDAAAALGGPGCGPIAFQGYDGYWSGPTGLSRVDPAPDGWRWTPSRNCMRPVQGKAGDVARAWLKDHRLPITPSAVMQHDTGMPTMATTEANPLTGKGYWHFVRYLLLSGVLFATYNGGAFSESELRKISDVWQPMLLSEYHAYLEGGA